MTTNENKTTQSASSPSEISSSSPKSHYDADNIIVLEGLEGVRKRPAMYIGSTGKKGFHHLAFEVLDNSIDENMAGFADTITLTLNNDGSCTVHDNGRGIPVAPHPKKKISTLEVIFSSLHSGGKFDKKSYAVSGGLHGVGLAVVNACSEWGNVKIWRNGLLYKLDFGKGHLKGHTQEIEDPNAKSRVGTEITFFPDREIFTGIESEEHRFDYEYLATRLRDLAFLNPIKIHLIDRREGSEKEDIFHYENGLVDFVTYLNTAKKVLHQDVLRFTKKQDGYVVDLSIQYNESYNTILYTFVNNINTIEGGTHLTGFKTAMTRAFNNYLKNHPKLLGKSSEQSVKGPDVREGMVAVLSLKVPEPQFEGQTKTKLGNPQAQSIVTEVIYDEMSHYFDHHPENTSAIMQKILMAQRARIASKKARDLTRRKSALDGLRLPGKLADCSSKNPEECELFIVEGDSAGGSAKQGRDRRTQAILPLRGKILNVEKSRLGKILSNLTIAEMIKAIGVGIKEDSGDDESDNGGIEFDLSGLRYHRIIVMCDADVDGHHIETLLMTFFFRFMRPLVDNGHVYLAVPPIYKLRYNKKEKYLYIEDDATKLANEIDLFQNEHKIKNRNQIKISRFKGLGEMNPEQLWDTTMDPSIRLLKRVMYEDYAHTDQVFSVLMGDDVDPRREFILKHYDEVRNLDI